MKCCNTCGIQTKNSKYCSRSSAAISNNKLTPKRKPEGNCKSCGCKIKKSRTYCKPCFIKDFSAQDMTLEESIYTAHHKSAAFALVRFRARNTNKFKNSKCCSACGYTKHVECCHIKPISSFSKKTLLSKINNENNIIALCPNCHWEFDHTRTRLV